MNRVKGRDFSEQGGLHKNYFAHFLANFKLFYNFDRKNLVFSSFFSQKINFRKFRKLIVGKQENLGPEIILTTFRGSEKQDNLFFCCTKGKFSGFTCKFWL